METTHDKDPWKTLNNQGIWTQFPMRPAQTRILPALESWQNPSHPRVRALGAQLLENSGVPTFLPTLSSLPAASRMSCQSNEDKVSHLS